MTGESTPERAPREPNLTLGIPRLSSAALGTRQVYLDLWRVFLITAKWSRLFFDIIS